MREPEIMRRIMLACGRGAVRLFRNNVGIAWQGRSRRFSRAETVIVQPGDVLIRQAQAVRYGLCDGSSDLIGWVSHVVAPEDVGRTLAVFAAVEVKTQGGRATDAQRTFVHAVCESGGVAGIARSEDEAAALLGVARDRNV